MTNAAPPAMPVAKPTVPISHAPTSAGQFQDTEAAHASLNVGTAQPAESPVNAHAPAAVHESQIAEAAPGPAPKPAVQASDMPKPTAQAIKEEPARAPDTATMQPAAPTPVAKPLAAAPRPTPPQAQAARGNATTPAAMASTHQAVGGLPGQEAERPVAVLHPVAAPAEGATQAAPSPSDRADATAAATPAVTPPAHTASPQAAKPNAVRLAPRPASALATVAPPQPAAALPLPPAPPAAVAAPPVAASLIVVATGHRSLVSWYRRVYRGLTAPDFATVAALNPKRPKRGDVLTFPPPADGWHAKGAPDTRQ